MQCIVTKTILVSFLWCQYTIDTMKDILYVSRSGKNPQKGAGGSKGCAGDCRLPRRKGSRSPTTGSFPR